ncbi:hypothetical protein [Mariniphaga sp.]|uniref:hypothetical protein n=1 Tax=Mariniphaga sp. TaxID=1954475 RepID=UPI003561911E
MKVRLLAMGLFEDYKSNNLTQHYNYFRIRNYYKDTVYHFNFEKKVNSEFKISPKGGFFSPLKAETFFYEKEPDVESGEFISVVKRKPSFFVFILPNPVLERTDLKTGYKINDITFRGQPFESARFHDQCYLDSLNKHTLTSDITGKIKIIQKLRDFSFINNFLENNCHPIFIKDPYELFVLINDYKFFVERTLNLKIGIKSFSKIIIPFFKLEDHEKRQLALTKSYNYPYVADL